MEVVRGGPLVDGGVVIGDVEVVRGGPLVDGGVVIGGWVDGIRPIANKHSTIIIL